jgi:dienelactone hydrolase
MKKTLWAFGAMAALVLIFALAVESHDPLVTQTVQYQDGDTILQGYLAYDSSLPGKRPGILVVHEWWGLNDYTRKRTEALARLGYVALAADMYGKGMTTKDPKKAKQWSGHLKGTPLLRARALRALRVLSENERTDSGKLGAIGFCFGGTTVLELAYTGQPIAGVVSFHGGLPIARPEEVKQIQARILVLHGAEDSFVSKEQIDGFQAALHDSGVDWQMVFYGGAVHSFSNPAADSFGINGVAYNADAARRGWQAMKAFLDESFIEEHQSEP